MARSHLTTAALRTVLAHEEPQAMTEVLRDLERARMTAEDYRGAINFFFEIAEIASAQIGEESETDVEESDADIEEIEGDADMDEIEDELHCDLCRSSVGNTFYNMAIAQGRRIVCRLCYDLFMGRVESTP